MKLTDMYPGVAAQQASAASPARDSAQKAASPAAPSTAVSVSWVGLLIAAVLLRLVYEMSE